MVFSNRDIINKIKKNIRKKHKGGMFGFKDLQDSDSDTESESDAETEPATAEVVTQTQTSEESKHSDDDGWNSVNTPRRVVKKRAYFEGYNNPNSNDRYYTLDDFKRWYSRRRNFNTGRNYTDDEIQDIWDNKSYTKGKREDVLRNSNSDCEKNFVYSKPCNKISKCCDTSQNRLCHFKDDVISSYSTVAREMNDTGKSADKVCDQENMREVEYCKMSRDHREYKALETSAITDRNSYRNASTLTEEEKERLIEAVAKRQLWLNNYYKDECRRCDGDCKDHQGRITSGETAISKGGKSRKRRRKRRTRRLKKKKRRSKKKYNKHNKTLRKK